MTKYVPYTLSSEQVDALWELLLIINLATLSRSGEVITFDNITPEKGQILQDLYYSETFGEEVEEDQSYIS